MKPMEPLELAEQRYDRVMCRQESTYEEKFEAAVSLCCRAYALEDADSAIRLWLAEHPEA